MLTKKDEKSSGCDNIIQKFTVVPLPIVAIAGVASTSGMIVPDNYTKIQRAVDNTSEDDNVIKFNGIITQGEVNGGGPAGPIVSVEPLYTMVSPEDTFTVNITVDPRGNEIYGAQYELYFDNNSLLRSQGQNKGPFLSQDGASTIMIINYCDNTHSKTEYAETRAGVSYGVNNPCVLAKIEFEVIGNSGSCEFRLDEVILSDPEGNITSNVTINHGTALGGHNTTLFVDSIEVAYDRVDVILEPNESYTGCFTEYNWAYTPTNDNITVCADSNNTVDESNETNNFLIETWKCGDVDMDGNVDFLGDAIGVARHYMYGDPIECLWAGDVDCSGNIDFLGDAIKIA